MACTGALIEMCFMKTHVPAHMVCHLTPTPRYFLTPQFTDIGVSGGSYGQCAALGSPGLKTCMPKRSQIDKVRLKSGCLPKIVVSLSIGFQARASVLFAAMLTCQFRTATKKASCSLCYHWHVKVGCYEEDAKSWCRLKVESGLAIALHADRAHTHTYSLYLPGILCVRALFGHFSLVAVFCECRSAARPINYMYRYILPCRLHVFLWLPIWLSR